MLVAIYALVDPDTGQTMYVGRTTNLTTRWRSHIRSARRPWSEENHDLGDWIRQLLGRGKRPLMTVLERVPKNQWQERESYWIARTRTTNARLLNRKPGGCGRFSLPGEHRAIATSFRADHYNALKRIADSRAVSIPAVVREIVADHLNKREATRAEGTVQLPPG